MRFHAHLVHFRAHLVHFGALFVHFKHKYPNVYLGTGITNSRGISEGWSIPQAARDLLLKMVIYDPNSRIVPCDAMRDGYFET